MFNSKSLQLSALCLVLCIAHGSANASVGTVDQSNLSFNIGDPLVSANTPLGQSFTAGISGELTDINVFSNGSIEGGSNTLTLNILNGDGTGGTLLGSETATVSSNYNSSLGLYFLSINTAGLAINVHAGSQYTFDFTHVTGSGDLANRGILASMSNPYAGGRAYEGVNYYGNTPGWDLAFQTVVAVPEPETYAMMFASLGVMGFIARRKKMATK